MRLPSLTLIFSGIFIAYIIHTIWVLAQLFISPKCTQKPCFTSYLETNPKLQLVLFTSIQSNPVLSEVSKIKTFKNFNYRESLTSELEISIPQKTRKNGTMFMHVIVALDDGKDVDWKQLQRDGPTVIQRIKLTEFMIPKAATFNLLGESETAKKILPPTVRPISHVKSKVYVSILTDSISFSEVDVPPELIKFVRANKNYEFLPIVQNDFLRSRLSDLIEIDKNMLKYNVEFFYNPISTGKLRLILHVEQALQALNQLGFTAKDVDEVKGIFSDTNVYLLCGTFFVAGIHLLFDFLSFKNEIYFWKKKREFAGLSVRTTLWRAFSQIIIFLYLLDENTSMLVLLPAGIGTIIELWKCKKILKIEISLSGFTIKPADATNSSIQKAEEKTRLFDKEAMKYLSYLLYPLCIAGAGYSLIYQPHKSWYSWTINSLVNGVYAFGFLFMLPQLFINYKLKSVAALPWRAFMYKAFNTFIDDIFAFIITMPTSHRVACFRDDIVFVIYLYQRYLYPVDQNRIDEATTFDDNQGDTIISNDVADSKKLN